VDRTCLPPALICMTKCIDMWLVHVKSWNVICAALKASVACLFVQPMVCSHLLCLVATDRQTTVKFLSLIGYSVNCADGDSVPAVLYCSFTAVSALAV
jgi:hypothetical protein